MALLLCLSLSACITTHQTVMAEHKLLQKKLDEHIQEWETTKPIIKRFTKSEQDMNFLIAELDKLSALEDKPSDEQLNQSVLFVPPATIKAIPIQSPTVFAVHLASYKQQKSLIKGWYIYQKKYPALLKNKQAMMQLIDLSGTQYRRLIAAPYQTAELALEACKVIKKQQKFCSVVSYE